MLEQWIIDKLTPLKNARLIILADPQRMIRSGAEAVDGWAKQHGFTVFTSPFSPNRWVSPSSPPIVERHGWNETTFLG